MSHTSTKPDRSRAVSPGALFLALLLLCLGMMQGCAMNYRAPIRPVADTLSLPDAHEQFGERPVLADDASLHELEPAQQRAFLDWFHAPDRSEQSPRHRLYTWLERVTQGYTYDDRTFDAATTLRRNSGNCLSLAILTTALARLANVDIAWQLMSDEPVFELGDSFVKKGLHVRTVLLPPAKSGDEPGAPSAHPPLVIDYFPTGRERFVANLDTAGYLALYHGNMAGEALERNDLASAYWQARAALAAVPGDAAALNLLAVTFRRAGETARAEEVYRYAIAHTDDRLSLMKNYQLLLSRSGRVTEAEAIGRELEKMDDPSPFHWFSLAREAEQAGEVAAAIRYYGKALDRAPYLHEAWLGQALLYYREGRLLRAESALQQALETAQKRSTRDMYQAKLAALAHEG